LDLTLLFTVLGIIATAFVPLIGYVYKTRKEFRNYYSVIWKSSSRIKSKDVLGERPCEEYYFERNIDSFLSRILERKRNALIIGPPLSGKTRAVFHSVKQLKKSIHVLIPRSVSMPVFKLPKDYMLWKKRVIFIDDLQYYIERQDSYHLLFREAKEKNIPIIASCHSGREYKKVKNKLIEQNLDIDMVFGEDVIEMEKISADDGRKVAEKMGLKWDTVKFNGTIGSIFMRLSEMERRFDNCDNIEKTILRSLRNLYLSGVYDDNSIFRLEWVKKASGKHELEGKDFEWSGWLKTLEDKEFIKLSRRNKVWAEDAYLEYVVKPEVDLTQLEILEYTIEIFTEDAEILQMAGERTYDLGIMDVQIAEYMKLAITAFEKVLLLTDKDLNPNEYIKAQNYLGQAYWSLSNVQDTLENCRISIGYFNEILKKISIETNPFEYARIKNRIGNTFTAFAQVENRAENCAVAIDAYHEALRVFTITDNPQDYARANNNLGGAYLILAEAKDQAANYKRAIEAFDEALKVRTVTAYPKDYALTKNNSANTYANLSTLEDSEKNLRMAIESYKDVLKIHTKERSQLQYGLIMNNIGNAYSLLAMVRDKKENCEKAIDAFEKALEVRRFDQVPVKYANTMFNLADAYLVQSTIDDDPEILSRAVESFEEALKTWTIDKYPYQYGETQFGAGRAFIRLAEFENRSENYRKGIIALDEALKIFTEEAFPKNYNLIQEEISRAKKIFF
jgi:tetratricopeptide (TPR) repeat protein